MPTKPDTPPCLLVVGGLHVDEVACLQADFVEHASNPVSWQLSVGGVASNAARAAQTYYAKALRGSVNLHCALGKDVLGKSLVSAMQSQGITVSAQWIDGHTSDRYSAIINSSGDLLMGLADIELAEKLRSSAVATALKSGEITSLLIDANLSGDCIHSILQVANDTSTTVAAMTVSPAKAVRLLPVAKQIDLLFCNRREAMAIAAASGLLPENTAVDQYEILQLARSLTGAGFGQFVLTDGDADFIIGSTGQYTTHVTPRICVTHNVNGAGDALAGTSLAAISLGVSLEEAVVTYGISMAAEIITGKQLPLAL